MNIKQDDVGTVREFPDVIENEFGVWMVGLFALFIGNV